MPQQPNEIQRSINTPSVPYHTHNGLDSPLLGQNNSLVTLTGTQTLTNKTLTTPIINEIDTSSSTSLKVNAGAYTPFTTVTYAATTNLDLSTSNVFSVTLTGNPSLTVTNASTGQAFIISLVQDGSGNRTAAWFTTIKWAGGSAPTLTTTASKADTFGFLCVATDTYYGFVVGQDI